MLINKSYIYVSKKKNLKKITYFFEILLTIKEYGAIIRVQQHIDIKRVAWKSVIE